MTDLQGSVHEARSLTYCLNAIISELPRRVALIERGEVGEIANVRELCLALDRLALCGVAFHTPGSERFRVALLAVLAALEDVAARLNHREGVV